MNFNPNMVLLLSKDNANTIANSNKFQSQYGLIIIVTNPPWIFLIVAFQSQYGLIIILYALLGSPINWLFQSQYGLIIICKKLFLFPYNTIIYVFLDKYILLMYNLVKIILHRRDE